MYISVGLKELKLIVPRFVEVGHLLFFCGSFFKISFTGTLVIHVHCCVQRDFHIPKLCEFFQGVQGVSEKFWKICF